MNHKKILFHLLFIFQASTFLVECLLSSIKHKTSQILLDQISNTQIERIQTLIEERSKARYKGLYDKADKFRAQLDDISQSDLQPKGLKLVIKDLPQNYDDDESNIRISEWSIEREHRTPTNDKDKPNVLQLAHMAVGLAVHYNYLDDDDYDYKEYHRELDGLVQEALERIETTANGAGVLRGRQAADAAFWFALAGLNANHNNKSILQDSTTVMDTASALSHIHIKLLDHLARIAKEELDRYGRRASCRAVDILQVVERFAAAGLQDGPCIQSLYQTAAQCLLDRNERQEEAHKLLALNKSNKSIEYSFTDMPLMMIWRFSTKQRKIYHFQNSAMNHWKQQRHRLLMDTIADEDEVLSSQGSETNREKEELYTTLTFWEERFLDTTCPLVVDIGCGMGVSLNGLSSIKNGADDTQNDENRLAIDWTKCNFAGTDLSRLTVGYANGVAHRSGNSGRVCFCSDSAIDFVERLKDYPGPIRLIMIQFPTPFSLKAASTTTKSDSDDDSLQKLLSSGNSQLPTSITEGFMVTPELLSKCSELIADNPGSMLLVQSNCEDVAVYIRDIAENQIQQRFNCVKPPEEFTLHSLSRSDQFYRLPKRTERWIKIGGKRAEGYGWWKTPILPNPRGSTETEVACSINNTPVHRCLFTIFGDEVWE